MTRWPDASYSTIAGSEHRCQCHPVKIVKSRAGAGKFHCFEINIAVLIHCSFNSFKRSDQAIFRARGVTCNRKMEDIILITMYYRLIILYY